jgi:phosphinothricin acetyltransferase
MGFQYLATYKNGGYKLGKWKDVGWWQLIINDYIHEPGAPVAFNKVPEEFINAILK